MELKRFKFNIFARIWGSHLVWCFRWLSDFAYMGKYFLNVRMRGTIPSLTCLWTISIVTKKKKISRRFEKQDAFETS
jgi:hypothetical protein